LGDCSPAFSKLDWAILFNPGLVTVPINQFHRISCTVFGEDQVQTMSRQSGMAPHDFLSQLSQHLPRVVDSMTPNDRLPDEGTISV